MRHLLRFFQNQTKLPLPCWDEENEEAIEKRLLEGRIEKIVGHPRHMVMNAPVSIAFDRGFAMQSLRGIPHHDKVLELLSIMLEEVSPEFVQVKSETLQSWIQYPSHIFQAVTFQETLTLGVLFALRLKPESFDALFDYTKRKSDLTEEDFAESHEEAKLYLLSFFAMTPAVGTMLMARLFAHLIVHQKKILEVGFITALDEAARVGEKMGLEKSDTRIVDDMPLNSYRADLNSILRSDLLLRTLFDKSHNF